MSSKVLLIAESATLRFLIKRSFHPSCCEIIEAATYSDAVQQLQADPDIEGIVLSWLVLQTGEFKALLGHLESPQYELLPIVLIAASIEPEALEWLKIREKGALTLLSEFEDASATLEKLVKENSESSMVMSDGLSDEDPVRILFVDDSKSSRAYYTRILEKNHYLVTTAESVDDAWGILTSHSPSYFDLVITDYFMPNENGHMLCRRIRNTPDFHDLLTAVMTGTYFDDAIDISLRSGAIECMFKEESDQLFIARVSSMARMAKNQRSIELERQRLADILSSLGEGVYGVDTEGKINFVNPAALKILNYDNEEALIEGDAHELFHYLDEHNEPLNRNECHLVEMYRNAGLVRDWRTHFVNSKQQQVPISCTVVPMMIAGEHTGSVVAFRDIAQQEAMETQLRWQATHDPLTNLHNRRYFEEQLEIERSRLERVDSQSALLFLDLDRFKYINDTAGHEAGDKILLMVSKQLAQRIRSSDTLARLGGDEFAVILRDIDPSTLRETADKFREVLSTLHFTSGSHKFKVNGSIGVAVIDRYSETTSDIMANADIACHQAKAEGRDQTHIYNPASEVRFEMTSELGWATRLQQALDHDQFELFFQPILALADIDFDNLPDSSSDLWSTHHRYRQTPPTYIESLIRLRSEEGELIPPNLFLGSAERFGLMPKIDIWVIKKALAILQEAHDLGLYFTLGINISAITLEDQKAITEIIEVIRSAPVPARHLAIEITERSAITNMVGVKSFIDTINELGCDFALDDFGAGFSSFAQLRHLPVRFVKIEGEYVKNMANDNTDRSIVTAINDIAHSIGRQTIAEFVMNPEILRALQACGVDYAQGFYIAEPMSQTDLFVIYEDEPTVVSVPYEVEMRQ
jgi:diguanylate cyclase (GGDEF)-like protein/PAS domain S-box-containing protein